jgi:hypothetical protein
VPCGQLFAFSPKFWMRSALYALHPTFMKSTPCVKWATKEHILKETIIFFMDNFSTGLLALVGSSTKTCLAFSFNENKHQNL